MSNPTSPNTPISSPLQSRPTISTTLCPTVFNKMIEAELGPLWSHNLNTHWSLEKQINPTHYLTLCGWLLHKINANNGGSRVVIKHNWPGRSQHFKYWIKFKYGNYLCHLTMVKMWLNFTVFFTWLAQCHKVTTHLAQFSNRHYSLNFL